MMAMLLSLLLGGLIGLGGYTFRYGQGFGYLSNDPAACKNCHVINERSWSRTTRP